MDRKVSVKRVPVAGLLLVLLLSSFLPPIIPPVVAEEQVGLAVVPGNAPAGETLAVAGGSLDANEPFYATVTTPAGRILQLATFSAEPPTLTIDNGQGGPPLTAGDDGTVAFSLLTVANYQAGPWAVTVRGRDSGRTSGGAFSLTAPAQPAAPTAPAAPVAGRFDPGARVVVTADGANIREAASRTARSVATPPGGTLLTVTGAARAADDYTWWPVQGEGFGGWVADPLVAPAQSAPAATATTPPAPPPPPPPPRPPTATPGATAAAPPARASSHPGAQVAVAGNSANIRDIPSRGGAGRHDRRGRTTLTVTGDATAADDYTWWPVQGEGIGLDRRPTAHPRARPRSRGHADGPHPGRARHADPPATSTPVAPTATPRVPRRAGRPPRSCRAGFAPGAQVVTSDQANIRQEASAPPRSW